ncbi:MAG: DUF2961 domain-containing protein [Anaerolineae bacterium]|nr:DUF2961 domain-containing protein [Anaerolineae bacterium]
MFRGVSPLSGLATLRDARSHRASSWDRTGGNYDAIVIQPGETATLAEIGGAGCIRHIWFTIACEDRLYLRKLVLRMYWDGEESPSVETPVGDFFGVGHGVAAHFVSLPLNMTCGPGRRRNAGMNCFFPMPFATHARITIENPCQVPVPAFYYYIDYESLAVLPEDQGRFHAQWRCEHPCQPVIHPDPEKEVNLTGRDNYVLLEAEGRGHYVGCVLNVDNWNAFHQRYTWFGEGDDMIFIDADTWPPSLHGTGTEDYFCEAWGFPSGAYAGPYHGVSLAGDAQEWSGQWSLYRFHIEDPVHFRERLRVTIEHGHANDQGNDYSSVAYWYQTEPHAPFPPLPEVEKRLPRRHVV